MKINRHNRHAEIVIAENPPTNPEDDPAGLVPAVQRLQRKIWLTNDGRFFKRTNPRTNKWTEIVNQDFSKILNNTQIGVVNSMVIDNANFVRITGAMNTLNGISGGFDGRVLAITNVGIGSAMLINNQSISAAAQDRIITGTNGEVELSPGAIGIFIYDAQTQRWRMLNAPFIVDTVTIGATTTLAVANRRVIVNNGAANITITLTATFGATYNISRGIGSIGTITIATTAGQVQNLNGTLGATTTIPIHSASGAGLGHQFTFDGTNFMRV